MKKILAVSVASLMLVAGAAAAEADSAAIHVGDRLGSESATANQAQGTPIFVYLLTAAAVATIVALGVTNQHHNSVSP
jgi:hypothetical protein